MKNFSSQEKLAGEKAVYGMSEKAQAFYEITDPLNVWERDGLLYTDWGDDPNGHTAEELEKIFEEEYDLTTEDEEEEE